MALLVGSRLGVLNLSPGGPSPEPEGGEIWLVFGDSEAAGYASSLPEGFTLPTDGSALTWDWTAGEFVNAAAVNYRPGGGVGVSPWAIFAAIRSQNINAPVAVVNAGFGGAFASWWAKPGYETVYSDAVAAFNAAIASRPDLTLAGFICYIGANDAFDAVPAYQANMTTAIAGLRADVTGAAGKPVYQVMIPDGVPANASLVASWPTVRAQQTALASAVSNVHNIDPPADMQWVSTGSSHYLIHPGAQGNWIVAVQVADKINGGSGDAPTALAPTSIASLRKYLNPASGVTTPGGSVSQWVDAKDGEIFAQGEAGQQPAHSASNATLNNQPAVAFVDDTLIGDQADSCRFLHDGTGATIVLVLDDGTQDASEWLLTTTDGSQAGIRLTRSATEIRYSVLNGTGTYLARPLAVAHNAGKLLVVFQFSTGFARVMKGTQWTWSTSSGGDFVGAPSTAQQKFPLRVGGVSPYFYGGGIGEIAMFDEVLDDLTLYRLIKWLKTKYNIGWVA